MFVHISVGWVGLNNNIVELEALNIFEYIELYYINAVILHVMNCKYVNKILLKKSHISEYRIYCSMLN